MRLQVIVALIVSSFCFTGCTPSEETMLLNYRMGQLEMFLDSVEVSLELSEERNWPHINGHFYHSVDKIQTTKDSLSAETLAHIRNLEIRLMKLQEKGDQGHRQTIQEESESVLENLTEIASMNTNAWESVQESYGADLLWIKENSNYLSETNRARIDSLTKVIERKRRSEESLNINPKNQKQNNYE